MKFDKYISLIEALEGKAAKNPKLYSFNVFLLTALGYGYFVGLIFAALAPFAVVGFAVWKSPFVVGKLLLYTAKIWWALIPGLGLFFGFIGSAIKAITAKVPDPKGRELERSEAPEFFAFVDKACHELKARKPEKVLITDNFNAAIVTLPRFGIFGRKVFLLIGLPLMKALTPEQFEAVIAHEIGHISGKHGVFTKWAYQMREAWGRLIESQELIGHKFAALYKNFVDWFFPYFTAYSFVLMRGHEVDADRDAAKLVGARPLGEALILLVTTDALTEDFWRKVHQENVESETPSERMFSRMIGSLAFVNEERATTSLAKAVAVRTDFNDTHPSLADRLRAIGYWAAGELPALPPPAQHDAATVFLGARTEKLTEEFDAVWDEHAEKEWKTRHKHFQEAQKRVRELDEKRASGEATADDLVEIAEKLAEKDGLDACLPILEEASAKFPDNAMIWFNLGGVRLATGDESGMAAMDKAVVLDPAYKLAASEASFNYLRSVGRVDEAKAQAGTIDEENEILEKAQKERSNVFPEDEFLAHELPDEFIAAIPSKVAGLEEITAIYAVRKAVEYFPEQPCHVIFIALRKKSSLRNRSDAAPSTIFEIVKKQLDTGLITYFALLNGRFGHTQHYLDKIPGACIYQSGK